MSAPSLRELLIEATGGRYVIEGELGRGGMAVVFAATDARLKRPVAIKALPPELAFRGDVKSRFLREAQMAAGLSHPHIVPIYAAEESGGLVYMVMGLVRGESLAQRLHREGRLSFSDARRILRETADALALAHAHGVIHRDIKPDNILIEEATGRVLVTDFGIARALEGDSRLTATGVAVGTPAYMSPEQARGDDVVDGRADVYSLGVVGFQALAGEPPFVAPNTPALLLKHVSEPPPPLAERRAGVPDALRYAIERSLAKEPADRWPTAGALRDALADDAVVPALRAGEWRLPLHTNVAAAPAGPPPMPPFPVWRGGTKDERASWREAREQWKQEVRDQREAWTERLRDRVRARVDARVARAEERAASLDSRVAVGVVLGRRRGKNAPLSERIRSYQRSVVTSLFTMALLFGINAATRGFPWFIFPWMGLGIGILGQTFHLWQDGVRVRDLFRRPSSLAPVDAPAPGADPAVDEDARARALVGSDVLAGAHGSIVRRAVDDERAANDIIRSLAPADRAQLPDVDATLHTLLDRVASLSQALHRLDADVRPEQISQIEARLAEARALPEGAAERERRVSLLERQRTTVTELTERRRSLAAQLESASLVLHTMRLDLLRLRSAGIGSATADVNNVTQEARALSADIGRVLDAAAEVRKI